MERLQQAILFNMKNFRDLLYLILTCCCLLEQISCTVPLQSICLQKEQYQTQYCGPTDPKYQKKFVMSELGGDNLAQSSKITISGWWFLDEQQTVNWLNLFLFVSDCTAQTIPTNGAAGGNEVNQAYRMLAFYYYPGSQSNIQSLHFGNIQKINTFYTMTAFEANTKGMWNFGLFSLDLVNEKIKYRLTSYQSPMLSEYEFSITSSISTFASRPNLGLWLHILPGYCKNNGYMKDIFFHVDYYYDDEASSFEIMQKGEMTLISQYPLIYYNEDSPSSMQIIKDTSSYRAHAVRGTHDQSDNQDPAIFYVNPYWETRFYKGQYLTLPNQPLGLDFTIKFGFKSNWQNTVTVFQQIWEGSLNTVKPLIIQVVYISNQEKVKACLNDTCLTSTDAQTAGTLYYVYVSYRQIMTDKNTIITIQINGNTAQTLTVSHYLEVDNPQKVIIGEIEKTTSESNYYKLFDFEIYTGSYIRTGSSMDVKNCLVQFGKGYHFCAQCNSNSLFRVQQGQCYSQDFHCPNVYGQYQKGVENICRYDCPAPQQQTTDCIYDYSVDPRLIQQGVVDYSSTGGAETKTIAVTFSSAMIKIPQIFLTIKAMDDSADQPYDFNHEALAITVNGFDLQITKGGSLSVTSYKIQWLALADERFETGSLKITGDSTLTNTNSADKIKTFTVSLPKFYQNAPKIILSVVGFTTTENQKILAFDIELMNPRSIDFQVQVTAYRYTPIEFININWMTVPNYITRVDKKYDFDVTDVNNFYTYTGSSDRTVNNSQSLKNLPSNYLSILGITRIKKDYANDQNLMKISFDIQYDTEMEKVNTIITQYSNSKIRKLGYHQLMLYLSCPLTKCRDKMQPSSLQFQLGIDKFTSQNAHNLDTNAGTTNQSVTITFPTEFSSTPIVMLAISHIEFINTAILNKFLMRLSSVTSTGFTINYSVFTASKLRIIWASWIAILDSNYEYGEFSANNFVTDTTKTITFATAKSTSYKIFYSIYGTDMSSSLKVKVETVTITATNFQAKVSTTSGSTMPGVWVAWLAVPPGSNYFNIEKNYIDPSDTFPSAQGQTAANRWDTTNFDFDTTNYTDVKYFYALSSFQPNSIKWRMDFQTNTYNKATNKLKLSINLWEGYMENLGFNFIDFGKTCQVPYCIQCDPNNPLLCRQCQGIYRQTPDCSCPSRFYDHPTTHVCTEIPISTCQTYDPSTSTCTACVNTTSQNVTLNCKCFTNSFYYFMFQKNMAFDWTYSFPDVNNKFKLNLQWCDACLNTSNLDQTEISLQNSYNPLRSGDRRYNVISDILFNTTSSIQFSVKTNFIVGNFICQGIILDKPYSGLLDDNFINDNARDKSLCEYNYNWAQVVYADYGVKETGDLYNFVNGDIYDHTLIPNSFRTNLRVDNRMTTTTQFVVYFTLNQKLQTLINDNYQQQCQEQKYLPLVYMKSLKIDNSLKIITSATLNSNSKTNVYQYNDLGGNAALSKTNQISVSAWLYFQFTGYTTSAYLVPYTFSTGDVGYDKEYYIAGGYQNQYWRTGHKYPYYNSITWYQGANIPEANYKDKWLWIIQSIEVNEQGLGGLFTTNIYSPYLDKWVDVVDPLQKVIYTINNPRMALYVGSYSQFPGEGTSYSTQQWNGIIYDATWYVGVSARTMKKTTLFKLQNRETTPILLINYLDPGYIQHSYATDKEGYLTDAVQQNTYPMFGSLQINQQHLAIPPELFYQDFSVGYQLVITYSEPFEFMVFQRLESTSNNKNVFSIFHLYDPTIQAFRTKICVRQTCKISQNSRILTNSWQYVFITLHYKFGVSQSIINIDQNQNYEIDQVYIRTKQGEDMFEFPHYKYATNQLDSIVVLGQSSTFGVSGNQVKISEIRIEQGSFSLNQYENIYQIIPNCLFVSGKQQNICRECASGFIIYQGKCILPDNSANGCGFKQTKKSQFIKLPQNYFYSTTYYACHPCKPECELCNATTAYPNNCVTCQAPYIDPPYCSQKCGKTFSGLQLLYLRNDITYGYTCVSECPSGYCRDNDRALCRKCSEEPYTRGPDSQQFFLKENITEFWQIQENAVNLTTVTSICSTGYLENLIVDIIGGKSVFTTTTKMSKNYTGLPPHYQITVKMMAFFIDLGADASVVSGDLIIYLDQRKQTLSINSTESLNNAELCGLSTSKDKLNSYYFSTLHDRNFMNLQITSQLANWGVRNIEIILGYCHPTCSICSGPANYECIQCWNELTFIGGECVCQESIQYAVQSSDCTITSPCFTCNSCHERCNGCTGPSFSDCILCAKGYLNYIGSCIPIPCPAGYTQDDAYQICYKYDFNVSSDLFTQPINKTQVKFYSTEKGSDLIDTFTCGSSEYVGIMQRYPRCFQRQFDVNIPHSKCTLYYTIIKLDTWDNEILSVKIDGTEVYTKTYAYSLGSNQCLWSYNDEVESVSTTFSHNSSTLFLNMSSNVDGGQYYITTDEGWGIKNVGLKCFQCHPTCLTCAQTASDKHCLSCHSADFDLDSNQCYCKDGFYLKIQNPCIKLPCATCEKCNPSTLTCSGPGPYNAIDCRDGYVIDESKTCQKCPSTTYFENGACIDCNKQCQTCIGPETSDCNSCVPSLYLNTTLCGETCPAHYIADSILNKCIPDTVATAARYFNQTSFTDADVVLLNIVTFAPSPPSPITSDCNSIRVFGSEGHFGGNSLKVSINFASLPARDSIRISFNLFALGTWTQSDLLQIYLNDDTSNIVFSHTAYLANQTSPPYHCSTSNLATKQYYIFAFSDQRLTATAAKLTFQLVTSSTASQLSYAIQDIQAQTFNCHPFCATCTDTSASSCLSCAPSAFYNSTSNTCYCLSGEYLKVIPGCTTSPCSICAKCQSPCKDCFFDNEISCKSCVPEYYFAVNDTTCVLQCPPYLYIQNETALICMDCLAPCYYCKGTISNCTSCINGYFYDFQNFTCLTQCNRGYFGDVESGWCRSCDISCAACVGPFTYNCTECAYTFFNKTELDGRYSCSQCDINCLVCFGSSSTECTTCVNNVIFENNTCTTDCHEFYGYYPDLTAVKCKKCHNMCKECFAGTDLDCYQCIDNYYLKNRVCTQCIESCLTCFGGLSTQCDSCQPTYYFKSPSSCIKCPDSCILCQNAKNCTTCKENRVGMLCDCSMPNGIDYNGITLICGTCEIAMVYIKFQDNWLTINFDFDFEVIIVGSEADQEDQTHAHCVSLFPTNLVTLLGVNSTCGLTPGLRTGIIIKLDGSSTIMPGEQFSFKPNSIHRTDCAAGVNINQLMSDQLQAPGNPVKYVFEMQGPSQIMPICEVIEIKMINILNDALRGPKNLTWSLFSMTPLDLPHQTIINDLLSDANTAKSLNLTFPPRTLLEATEYIFQIDSFSYYNLSHTMVFTITTAYAEKLKLEVYPTGKLVTPRYSNFTAKIYYQHLRCLTATNIEIVQSNLNYTWNQISGTPNLNVDSSQQTTILGVNFTELFIPAFTTKALESYTFVYFSKLLNKPINDSIELTFSVSQSALKSQIVGSSRIASFQQSFFIECTASDPDIPADDPDPHQGMIFNWTCTDLNLNQPCADMLGNVIPLPSPSNTNINMTFAKKTFQPYKSFQFVLTVTKDSREMSDQAIIMFQEFDLPQLALDVPPNLLNSRVNLNDEIFIKINYSSLYNPDSLFYSATFLYNFDEVATMVFRYVTVRFKIWEKFTNFNLDNNLIVRFSVYNPLFMMPSQMTVSLQVNIPPQNCILSVNQQTGEALSTDFAFTVSGCTDSDQPLTYKFFMYKSFNDSQKEILNPVQSLRTMLCEFTPSNSITTKLVQGLEDFSMEYTFMVSVRDDLGGLTNLTLNMTVNQNQNVATENQAGYLATLQSIYTDSQQSGVSFGDNIRQIGLIVLDFSRSNLMLPNNTQFINFKKQLLNTLQTANQNIPVGSTWDEQITQLISILMINSSSMIASISPTEVNNQLTNMDSLISNSGSQLSSMPVGSRDQQQTILAAKLDSLLINCAGVIDGMIQGVNSNKTDNNSTNSTTNSTANNTNNETDQLNKKMVNMTQSISNMLVINTLPNESPKVYNGDSIQIKAQQISPKYLDEYFGNDDTDWTTEEEEKPEDTSKGDSTFKVAFKNYKTNPYANDPNYPNRNATFKVIDPAIYQENSTDKMNISKKIKHSFTIPFRPNLTDPCYNYTGNSTSNNTLNCSNATNSSTRILQTIERQEVQVKCISLQVDGTWGSKTCEKAEQKEPDGTTSVKCICKDLSATSVTEDLVNIFANNPNVQNIIDINKGFDMISKMEWWLYVIFYFGAAFTLLWLRLVYYGYYKDIEQFKNFEIEQAKQQAEETENEKVKKSDSLKENDKQKQLEFKIPQDNKKKNTIILVDKKQENVNDNQNEEQDIQLINEAESVQQQDSKSQNNQQQTVPLSKDEKIDIEQDKVEIKRKEKKEITFTEQSDSKFMNFIIGMFSYHEFLSVFHQFDNKLSRPIRFTMYYVKVVFFMATTAVFSGFLNFIQTILFSIISGVAFSIITLLLIQLLKRNVILKLLGIIILLGVLAFCWYASLVVAATRGVYDSNMWALQFLGTFIMDNFVVQLLQGATKYSLLIYLLTKQAILSGGAGAVVKFIIKALVNDRIKTIFRFD